MMLVTDVGDGLAISLTIIEYILTSASGINIPKSSPMLSHQNHCRPLQLQQNFSTSEETFQVRLFIKDSRLMIFTNIYFSQTKILFANIHKIFHQHNSPTYVIFWMSRFLFSPTSRYLGGECWWRFFTNMPNLNACWWKLFCIFLNLQTCNFIHIHQHTFSATRLSPTSR